MAETLLELQRVTIRRGEVELLREVSLQIPAGRHTVILGPNGAGKTSLLRVLERELYPSITDDGQQGHVTLFGRSTWDVSQLRRRMGIVSAMVDRDFSHGRAGNMTVAKAVASGFTATKLVAFSPPHTAEVEAAVAAALQRVAAAHLAERTLATLSTGERRRVLIARSLVHQPELLVLDEPTTGLDLAARHQFLTMLTHIAQQPGLTLLIVTHHLEEIVPGFEHVVLLEQGRVAFAGPTEAALTPQRLSAVFGLPLHVSRNHAGLITARVAADR